MPRPISRRSFVAAGVGAVSGAAAAPLVLPSSVFARAGRPAPADRIAVAFIGMGKRAHELLPRFLARPDCRVVAVCDADATRREHAQRAVNTHYADRSCAAFLDYTDLLARPSIDAVVIATPDHWHALQAIHAARAAKDIYCEQPVSTTLRESRLLIDAVRANARVFQAGSQQRSEYAHRFVTACEYVRAGRLGRLLTIHVGAGASSAWCTLPAQAPEPGLDWDRWLGPAPHRPYNPILAPRGVIRHYPAWRAFREFAGGPLAHTGSHNFDIAQWALDADASGPLRVSLPDPDSPFGAFLTYAGGVEVHHAGPFGVTFTGTDGQIHVWRDRLSSIPSSILAEPLAPTDLRLPRRPDHVSDFLACVRSRARCVADVEAGARAAACAHLCNAAYWSRRSLAWDSLAWRFPDDATANATLLDRERRPGFTL
jgi:predicted dehydrogenase